MEAKSDVDALVAEIDTLLAESASDALKRQVAANPERSAMAEEVVAPKKFVFKKKAKEVKEEPKEEPKKEEPKKEDAYTISMSVLDEMVHILRKEVRKSIEAGDFDMRDESKEEMLQDEWISDYVGDNTYELAEDVGDKMVEEVARNLKGHYSNADIARGMSSLGEDNKTLRRVFGDFIKEHLPKKAKNS